ERQETLAATRAQTAALLKLAEGASGAQPAADEPPSGAPAVSAETLFQCPKCDLAPFTTQDALDKHVEKKHKE
ncbi:hypothetical protein LCGC14_3028220, partial [marine sediment metagenome]